MADDIVGSFLPTAGTGDSGPIRKPTVEQPYARGTALLPPVSHWHALRPRDEAGSAALRVVTDAQVQNLLLAAQRVPDGKDLGPAGRTRDHRPEADRRPDRRGADRGRPGPAGAGTAEG